MSPVARDFLQGQNVCWSPRSFLKWITLIFLMVAISRFKADQCANKVYEHNIHQGGSSIELFLLCRSFIVIIFKYCILRFTQEVHLYLQMRSCLAHHVEGSPEIAAINCYSLCKKDVKCVWFSTSERVPMMNNCQLTNETESKNKNSLKIGEWKLFRDVER